jgi:hypothetical protein
MAPAPSAELPHQRLLLLSGTDGNDRLFPTLVAALPAVLAGGHVMLYTHPAASSGAIAEFVAAEGARLGPESPPPRRSDGPEADSCTAGGDLAHEACMRPLLPEVLFAGALLAGSAVAQDVEWLLTFSTLC